MSQLLETLQGKTGLDKSEEFYSYLRRTAWEKGIPLYGSFELTPQCTLDCKMCYVHLRKDQMKQEELKAEQWISLIDQACDAGMMFANLTGGECLMYPGFRKIYEHLQDRGVVVSVLTNGTLLDEDTVAWLAERPPEKVQISVYGSSPAGYENVTGYATAFRKVDHAIELTKFYRIPLSLAITTSKQLYPDFEAVLRYCRSKSPDKYSITPMLFRSRAETDTEYDDYALTLDDLVDIAKISYSVAGKSFSPFDSDSDLLESCSYTPPGRQVFGITCIAGRCSFAITWDGKMQACNSFNFVEATPLQQGFCAAWSFVNEKSTAYQMPLECISCSYYNACFHCPAMHWLAVGEGHCNIEVCNEGKRMAREGLRTM